MRLITEDEKYQLDLNNAIDNACSHYQWAHSANHNGIPQLLSQHSENVAIAAGETTFKLGMGREIGYYLGMVHDIGKAQPKFQARLRGNTEPVNHKDTAVAYMMRDSTKNGLLAFISHAHHGGLKDLNKETQKHLMAIFEDETHKDYFACANGISYNNTISSYMEIKMAYSALVNADHRDTETHYGLIRNNTTLSMIEMLKRLQNYRESKFTNIELTALNQTRENVRSNIVNNIGGGTNIFTVTGVTGIGKFLSCIEAAIKHAIETNQTRIIYVAPFMALIDQAVEELNAIFGDEYVLPHYSTASESEEDCAKDKLLAEADWNYPIIATTVEQFFESIWSRNPSQSRKVHNISNAGIIIDEVHSIPIDKIAAALHTCGELTQFNNTFILSTATPINYDCIRYNNKSGTNPTNMTLPTKELVDTPEIYYDNDTIKRIVYKWENEFTFEQLIEQINKHDQYLCILNFRKNVRKLSQYFVNDPSVYILSTWSPPHYRKKIIAEVRKKLSNNIPCKLITTSCVEAGVDLDFRYGSRELTTLSSIYQASGRVNRNNKFTDSVFTVFKFAGIKYKDEITEKLIAKQLNGNIFVINRQMIKQFFQEYLSTKNADKDELICNMNKLNFKTIHDKRRLIEDKQKDVVVGDAVDYLLDKLPKELTRTDRRKIAEYTISIYDTEYDTEYNMTYSKVQPMMTKSGYEKATTRLDEKIGITNENNTLVC